MKQCLTCGATKTLSAFYKNLNMRDGHLNRCRACVLEMSRAYRSNPENRARQNQRARERGPRPAEQVRRQRLWSWYRMTPEQFADLLDRQGGRCAIAACGATEPGGRGEWHVDHDHACCDGARSCGACVRGLLCSRCNPMLGMARDNQAVLLSAAEYLQTNAVMGALGPIGG